MITREVPYTPQAIIESLLMPGVVLACGFYLNPSDPFFISHAFPWVWLAPALVGLRYGLWGGCLALSVVIGAVIYAMYGLNIDFPDYTYFILGGVLLTAICSESKQMWSKQKYILEKQADYFEERIESLSREYTVLRFSHTRLEQSLITKPITLREALLHMNNFLQETQGILTKETADRFLQLLVYYSAFERGALYLYHNHKIDVNPIAQVGINKSLDLTDPLVLRAIETQQTCCFAINDLEAKAKSQYLAVAPLLCSDGRLLGLLTISDMPFLMLQGETLRVLSILLAYFSDELWASQQAVNLQKQYPDCHATFATELFKLDHLWRDIKVDSALIAVYLKPHPDRATAYQEILAKHRALDRVWQHKTAQCDVIIILMPLAGNTVVKGRVARIADILARFPEMSAEVGLTDIRYWQLGAYPTLPQLLDVVMKHDFLQ
jgi:hypothetical protein